MLKELDDEYGKSARTSSAINEMLAKSYLDTQQGNAVPQRTAIMAQNAETNQGRLGVAQENAVTNRGRLDLGYNALGFREHEFDTKRNDKGMDLPLDVLSMVGSLKAGNVTMHQFSDYLQKNQHLTHQQKVAAANLAINNESRGGGGAKHKFLGALNSAGFISQVRKNLQNGTSPGQAAKDLSDTQGMPLDQAQAIVRQAESQ
jgi:hypothetical protein